MGSAEESHPKEIKALSEHIISLGAKLVRPEHEDLNYQPGLSVENPELYQFLKMQVTPLGYTKLSTLMMIMQMDFLALGFSKILKNVLKEKLRHIKLKLIWQNPLAEKIW